MEYYLMILLNQCTSNQTPINNITEVQDGDDVYNSVIVQQIENMSISRLSYVHDQVGIPLKAELNMYTICNISKSAFKNKINIWFIIFKKNTN